MINSVLLPLIIFNSGTQSDFASAIYSASKRRIVASRPLLSIAGRLKCLNNESDRVLAIVGSTLVTVTSNGKVSTLKLNQLDKFSGNLTYVRADSQRKTFILGDDEGMMRLIDAKGSVDARGVASAFFENSKTIGIVPAFERPFTSSNIGGYRVKAYAPSVLDTGSVRIKTSDNQWKTVCTATFQDTVKSTTFDFPLVLEWPNISYSPLSGGSGVVSIVSSRDNFARDYRVLGASRWSPQHLKSVAGKSFIVQEAWSALNDLLFVGGQDMALKSHAFIENVQTGKVVRLSQDSFPIWIPQSNSLVLITRRANDCALSFLTFSNK